MYGMSKVMINAWVKWWAFQEEVLSRGIQVYALCPGYVKTDIGINGKRTLAEGAVCPLYLINLPYQMDKEKHGKFFVDCKITSLLAPGFVM